MKDILILQADDWEGLYINERLITEEHRIGRMDLMRTAEKYLFGSQDLRFEEVTSRDRTHMEDIGMGSFYEQLSCWPDYENYKKK